MRSRRNFVIACVVVIVILLVLYPSRDSLASYHVPLPASRPAHEQQQRPNKQAAPEQQSGPRPSRPESIDHVNEGPRPSHDDVASAFANFAETDRPLMPTGDPLCAQLPGADSRIVMIVKTGASESFSKVPTQLQTILRCVPELLIFSDMEQTIAGIHVRDSLDTVLDSVKKHSDFALYHAQKECMVSQADCTRHRDKAKEGWNLDKYKNIHIAEKAYNLRPGYDWYVVIDADTYLFWTTLVAFLARLDPSRKLLLGSITHFKDFPFAHGGSGYAVSGAAMNDFVGRNPGVGNAYDKRVVDECCGDWMFSKAMKELSKISATQSFPTINGDKVWSLSFGPTHWCHPLASMHHVDSEEMSLFWEFETKMYLKRKAAGDPAPLTIRDMYFEYFEPRTADRRDDWDNVSDDIIFINPNRKPQEHEKSKLIPANKQQDWQKVAHESFSNCRTACEKTPECFQFIYYNSETCCLSKSFKIGYPTSHSEDVKKRQVSGWLTDRIKEWVDKQGECTTPIWPQVKSHFF